MADSAAKPTEFRGPLHVAGGKGGAFAEISDILTLAQHTEEVGANLAAIAAACHDVLVDGDVLASAVLDPDGFARFEARLFGALDGGSGLTMLAAQLYSHGVLLRTAANSYRALDQGYATLIDSVRWAGGVAVGSALTATAVVAPGLLLAGGTAAGTVGAAGYLAGVNYERLLTNHLGAVDVVVGALPGVITGLPLGQFATDVPSGARVVGMLYPDGDARVTDLGVDTSDARMTKVPASYQDLLSGLDYRNKEAKLGTDHEGQIDVRVVTQPDGHTRSYIVDVPGTKTWNLMPLQHNERLTDLSTNVHALGGETTAYEQGIAEALRRAGAQPGDPVMLIGHSQGGIVAAQAAADPDFRREFNVTHVVTAASPVARFDIPESVKVLSLQNEHDLVPRLDGIDNPDRVNHTTVTFAQQNGSIVDNHGMGTAYLPVAGRLDASTDASIVDYRESAKAFLHGNSVESRVYEVKRK